MSNRSISKRALLTCSRLEDRDVPAQFGVPFADPAHLTLSFAPDGTTAADVSSGLFAALDAAMPRAAWQHEILRAAQTWAELSNVNVGLAGDSGASFRTTGPTQGDSRFGDLRLGGFPMSAEALAVAVPSDPFVSGTFAGDIFLNTNTAYTSASLYAVALHEVGHALGLAHSTDPNSVMFDHLNQISAPSASDAVAIRALYGARGPDANEKVKGNATAKLATRIPYDQVPGGFDGSTPAIAYGDVTKRTDVDVFLVKGMLGYTGPMSIRVQTTGVSLLAPRVTVYNSLGRIFGQATATGDAGSTLTVTIPRTVANAKYYIRIQAAPGAPFGVGRYGVGVTFDNLLQPTALTLDAALRGPFEAVHHEDVPTLFRDPANALFESDLHVNDTVLGAVKLITPAGFAPQTHYRTSGSVNDLADIDFFRIRSPRAGGGVLTVNVHGVGPNAAAPRVQLFDKNLVEVPATILVNANGSYTVQTVGVGAKVDYYLRVSGTQVGNYNLDAAFGATAAVLAPLGSATLAAAASDHQYTLFVGQTQLFGFTMSATGAAGASAQMTIVDSLGRVVYSLIAPTGDTTSATSTLLPPGEYTVHVTPIPSATGDYTPVSYSILGSGLTDPIGPVVGSTTLTPQYQDPTKPGQFLYPIGKSTFDPYLWVIKLLI